MPGSPNDWYTANQRYLSEALQRLRDIINLRLGEKQDPLVTSPTLVKPFEEGMPALERVCVAFGLSPFERDVLLLCAGVELDSSFSRAIAALHGDEQRTSPTFSLALGILPDAHWSALTPAAPLRRWRLVRVSPGDSLAASPLRIDERLLHFLAGVSYLDEDLEGIVTLVPASSELPAAQKELARQVATAWMQMQPGVTIAEAPLPVIYLCGERDDLQAAVAAAACQELNTRLYRLESRHIPSRPAERELLARLWEREAVLDGSVLLVDLAGLESSEQRPVAAFLETLGSPVIVACREALPLESRPTLRLDTPLSTTEEQRQLWQSALGAQAASLNGSLDVLASQFRLSPSGIRSAVSEALAGPGAQFSEALWEAGRRQARRRLDDLAQRIETTATWDDIVLPAAQRQTLHDLAAQVRQRRRVYEEWGLAKRSQRSLGINALFAGPSGTGKTLAAEVLADALRLDLYRIDLSAVVSKYIGETEKNLRRVFDAAEDSGAILLFDEADALFGRRSEVKDSHDRYANVEVSYLLQRMESYHGLAILTTNLKNALDPAFLRRIRFVVSFPFPDAAQRSEIWKRMFPPQTPIEGLDETKLGQLSVAGGNIRSIALNAAFIAAEAGEPVRMSHLLRAARSEYAKLEKTLSEAEISGWVSQ